MKSCELAREQMSKVSISMELEIPDCSYPKEPCFVCPSRSTPRHTLYLSNLDDQKFLRFSIKYLYVYKRSVAVEALKASLSRALVEFYPLAGRLRRSNADGAGEGDGDEKLEVDCNGEGAVFAEAHLDLSAEKFLQGSARPNRSWRKLLYRVEAHSFVDVPPLVIQVTHLSCGGMILCTAINHCLCDAIGTAHFLHAWAQLTSKPTANLPVAALHSRCNLKPRDPPRIDFSHPEFSCLAGQDAYYRGNSLFQFLVSQPLVPVSDTFTASQILHLKKQCVPSLKCTSFEVLAWHVWRAWITALDPSPSLHVKLLFSMNVRKKLEPELPGGFYGNGFVLACAETSVDELVSSNAHLGVRLVQKAKESVSSEYVRSMIDLLEERRTRPDLSSSLVISPWTKLGLEDVDLGEGRPIHMGPLASEIYCLFLPVVGDLHSFTMLMSVPQSIADRFRRLCFIDDSADQEKETETATDN